jgi:hypothetical protein
MGHAVTKPEVDLIIRGAQIVSPDRIWPASVAIAGEQHRRRRP